MLGAHTRWFNAWALLMRLGGGHVSPGTAMAIAIEDTGAHRSALTLAGHSLPGLHCGLVHGDAGISSWRSALTPVFNGMRLRQRRWSTARFAADYQAVAPRNSDRRARLSQKLSQWRPDNSRRALTARS